MKRLCLFGLLLLSVMVLTGCDISRDDKEFFYKSWLHNSDDPPREIMRDTPQAPPAQTP